MGSTPMMETGRRNLVPRFDSSDGRLMNPSRSHELHREVCRPPAIAQPLSNVRCSRRAPAGLTDERRASGIAVAKIASVDASALAAELGR